MKRYGLVGENIQYSFSPKIHQKCFKELNLKASYDLIDIGQDDFEHGVENILNQYQGINVTIPYKEKIIPFLDELDERAEKIGAVNTVRIEKGFKKGFNTDCDGFLFTLEHYFKDHQNHALILGSGGAAKMAKYVLKTLEFEKIFSVSRQKSNDPFEIQYEDLCELDLDKYLLINTTPMGSKQMPNQCPVTAEIISQIGGVFDMIYTPAETPLLKKAREVNKPHVNGLPMLIIQAIEAQKIWQKNVNNVFKIGKDLEKSFKLLFDDNCGKMI